MTGKPVYLAGRGFQSENEVRKPRWPLPLLGLALLVLILAVLGWRSFRPQDRCRLEIHSTPPGAEILLDLEAGHGRTPAVVEWRRDRELLVQVRLPGHESQPLGQRLSVKDLSKDGVRLDFRLIPLPASPRVDSAALPSPPSSASSSLATPAASPPDLRLSTPAPRPVATPGGHTLAWQNWDPAFRLRVDGRTLPGPTQVLAPGSHRVQVELRGRNLLDTLLQESGAHRLILPGLERFVEVRVQPAAAEIVLGDQSLGKGRALISRGELPVRLVFPALPGLLPPASATVGVGSPGRLDFQHSQGLDLRWTPGESRGLNLLDMGYEMGGRYQVDAAHGPRREGGILLLGRAFHDRRPGGAQALRLVFEAPEGLNRQWQARLEIDAVDSGKRHPMTLNRGATLTVLLNGTALVKDMPLAADEAPRSWPVSALLKPGRNELRIQSSESSRSSTALRGASVKVGP